MMKRTVTYLFLFLLGVSACKPKYDSTNPKMAPVTEAVFASGSIEPKDVFALTSLSDGFIVKTNVVENDLVQKGQVLFELDNTQQQVLVKQAESNLNFSKIYAGNNSPTLLQVKAQLDAARAKLVTDSVNAGRYKRLIASNSVSKQEYDNAMLNYESSLSAYRAMLATYNATREKVKQDLANSNATLQTAEAGNQYYQLKATGTYRVYTILKKTGELVKRGEQVAQLGNPDSIVVSMDVDEGSIGKIQLGQQVLVELNTMKNTTYEAHVSKIYPHFYSNTQSYKVEAKFAQHVPGIIAGTQLQANIIIAKKDQAMVIPRAYLSANNKVLVQKDKRKIDSVTVKPGIVSDDWVEVLSGLTTADKIIKEK